jgi:hypothetical protein
LGVLEKSNTMIEKPDEHLPVAYMEVMTIVDRDDNVISYGLVSYDEEEDGSLTPCWHFEIKAKSAVN